MTLFEVVGFEGFASNDVPLVFGAAALCEKVHHRLWNAVTWHESSFDNWKKFVSDRTVTPCPWHEVDLVPREGDRCVLRACHESPVLDALIEWFEHDAHGAPSWSAPAWRYWLVPFQAMKPIAAHILKRAETAAPEVRDVMRKQAYVLDHEKDPWFKSLRTP